MNVRLFVGLCLCLAIVAACSRPARPEFRTLDNVKFGGADLRNGTVLLTADAEFHNPNGIALDVTALELTVFLDDTQAATVRQNASIAVAAHADFKLPVQVDVPIQVIVDALEDEGGSVLGGLLAGKEVEVRVEGWVRVSLGGIAIDAPVQHQELVRVRL